MILIVWLIRLVKRGNDLVNEDDEKGLQNKIVKDDWTLDGEDQLFNLAKAHHNSKIRLDDAKMNETKIKLVEHLDSEYKKMNKKHSKRIMLMKIRTSLIKNPYDQIGRKMAIFR